MADTTSSGSSISQAQADVYEVKLAQLEQTVLEQNKYIAKLRAKVEVLSNPTEFLRKEFDNMATMADVHKQMVNIKSTMVKGLEKKVSRKSLNAKLRQMVTLVEMAELQDEVLVIMKLISLLYLNHSQLYPGSSLLYFLEEEYSCHFQRIY